MPYYIGPTSTKSKTGWIIRKEDGQILPWNMENKVDIEKTSEAFITNLIRRCTYLSDKEVMPKCSLKYEKYMVLNIINNIKVNDERLDTRVKQKLFDTMWTYVNALDTKS